MSVATSILAVAALAGGAMSAYGQIQQGKQEQEAQNYNAQISEQEAGVIRNNAVLNEYRSRKTLAQNVGTMTASVAKSGIEMTGSPLDVIADSISNSELDIQIDKYNSEIEARGRESDARMRRYYGNEARTSSYYNAGATLLSSGATAYGRYKNYVPRTTTEEIGLGGGR